VERAREAALSAHGLSLGDFDVLATLRRAGGSGVNPKELASSALITSGAMTSRLDRLQTAGLVERSPDPADRRAVRVRLTAAGRQAADRALADVLAAHEHLLEPLTRRERDAAATALRKMLLARGDG
jgi:DNA-binding MarR family transcriptional regulator